MTPYPFSAVVGHDDLAMALLLNSVNPAIGGVLVRGEKGTAKSTMVRALGAVLPPEPVVRGCRFRCDPERPDPACPDGPHDAAGPADDAPASLVELPVGATEDRLVGSLDIERVLAEGVKAFEPGLLARAHRGLLYVDEVNLLHDHLVDALLDAAAMGRVHVERDGVSVSHASRFVLVGTMNPEEGELRPQLLDRFGLSVEVAASRDPAVRAQVVRRRLAYEADPEAFAAEWADQDAAVGESLARARALLPTVGLSDAALSLVASVCASFEVDGMRADLVIARAARAHAAWHDRTDVTAEDVRAAARLALPHRRRRDPFDSPGLDDEQLDDALDRAQQPDGPPEQPDPPEPPDPEDDPPPGGAGAPDDDATSGEGSATAPRSAEETGERDGAARAQQPFRPRLLSVDGVGEGASGRRSRARTPHGRRVAAERWSGRGRLDVLATVNAAAPHQHARDRPGRGLAVRRADLRAVVREGQESNLVVFCVDASGSMAARARMREVKDAVLSLLVDAYQRRDKVAMVTFRGADAEVALPPTSAVEVARARLDALPTGGRTPLAAGLETSARLVRTERERDPSRRPLLVVVTDGRATSGALSSAVAAYLRDLSVVVVDCERGPVRLGLAARLAAQLEGDVLTMQDLRADALTSAVREAVA
ncbi:MAG: putative cobaltochelatase [Actinomycetota bacterium]|nr:putative cobaltochelatase [Actinomycetota bacterium]